MSLINPVAYCRNQPESALFPAPIVAKRAPTTADKGYPIGQMWVYISNNAAYILTSVVSNSATWNLLEAASGAGVFSSLTVSPGLSSLSALTQVGTASINDSGAAATTIGVSGTGTVQIGNATGNVVVPAGNLTVSSGNIVATAGGITASAGAVSATNTGANRAFVGDTSGGTGVTMTLASSGATVDAIQLTGGGIKVAPVAPAAGASPRVASGRFGVCAFTDVINAAATGALAITNTMSGTGSQVMATVQCSTAGSALVIRNIDVSVAGTITLNVTNLGGSNTAANIIVTFWLLN